MVAVQMTGTDLSKVSAALRAQSPELRKAMGKQLRASAVPLRDAMRTAVLGLDATSTSGRGGAASRAAYAYSKTKAGRADTGGYRTPLQQANKAKALARATKRAGLRATIARGIRVEYRDSARADLAGITVRTTVAQLPADQRSLPMLMNAGSWRHPVFARRNSARYVTPGLWVAQDVTPSGWWTQTGRRWAPTIRRNINDAFQAWAIRAGVTISKAAEG